MTTRPTVASEAQWLIDNLRWIYDNEPKWDDFAKDVAAARRRLEAVLYAGERDTHGVVPCGQCGGELDRLTVDPRTCRCPEPIPHAWHGPRTRSVLVKRKQGKPLVLTFVIEVCCLQCLWDERHKIHDQGGLRDEWVCRKCHHTYDLDEYRSTVARDARDNATALNADQMTKRFPEVTVGQLRVWANRGFVHKRGRDELGRMLYDVADVKTRAADEVA
jgi:hypothetical protein